MEQAQDTVNVTRRKVQHEEVAGNDQAGVAHRSRRRLDSVDHGSVGSSNTRIRRSSRGTSDKLYIVNTILLLEVLS